MRDSEPIGRDATSSTERPSGARDGAAAPHRRGPVGCGFNRPSRLGPSCRFLPAVSFSPDLRFARFRSVLGALMLVLCVAGCTTVPETGRRQLNFLTPEQEMQMGLASFQEVKQQVPVSKDRNAAAMVQKVGKRIAAVAPLPGAQWEFVLFESPEANAFCLPGGKVGVYSGILPYTKDEAGLATVIGHEVAHAVARHGGERVSEQLGLEVVGAAIGSAMKDSEWQSAVVTAYGVGTQVGYALPHSRLQESEADEMGLIYMARAGYNPEEAVKFWQRFSELEAQGNSTPWFLRTHPVSADRIEKLKEMMPRAMQEYRAHGGQ